MTENNSKQRQLALKLVSSASEQERAALVAWSRGLLAIRSSDLSATQKAKAAIQLTVHSQVVWPATKIIAREAKRLAWDERGLKSRLGLAGVAVGATLFGGQGAGIAALGTAIGVPLWVVLGAGATFAGFLIEEGLRQYSSGHEADKATYRIIEAERKDDK
jgi:hypothetical protein